MVFVSVAYNVQCTIDIYVSQNEVQGHNMFFLKLKPIVFYSAWHCPLRYTTLHYRLLVPDNTQKILMEIWQHFWIKNDGEKWSRKIILKFHDGPQTCCCPVQKKICPERLNWPSHWRPPLNSKIFFSKPLFTIILSQK